MELTVKQKVIISVVALVGAFGAGWYATPTKVVTKTVTQTVVKEVQKQQDDTSVKRDNNTVTKTTETIKPDGTKVIQTVVQDKSTIDTTKDQTSSTNLSEATTTTSEKTVTKETGQLNLGVLVGAQLNNWSSGPAYGGYVNKRVLGPFSVGVFGLSNTTFGASVGVTF